MTEPFIALLLDASVRSAVAAALIALALAVLRVRSGALKHRAWTAALGAMLLMPLLTRVIPPLSVPLPAAVSPVDVSPETGPFDQRVIQGAPASGVEPGDRAPAGLRPPLSVAPPAPPPDSRGREQSFPWQAAASIVYLAGAALFLSRLLVGCHQVRRLVRSTQPVKAGLLAASWGRPVEPTGVFESPHAATPMTVGFFRPRIVLPMDWPQWPQQTLHAVLAHERAHVARRDPLVALAAHVNRCVFWFHPLAWWLERTVASAAEHACDDEALKSAGPPSQYADVLLDIATTARRARGRVAWQGIGVAGGGWLDRRIDRILGGVAGQPTSRHHRWLVAVTCAASIAVAVACRQAEAPLPLREDPVLAADLAKRQARSDFYRSAQTMSLQQAAELEAALERNPEDTITRERLLIFYQWTGKNTQSWNDNVAARRRHAVWLTTHHPEGALVRMVQLSRRADPAGYDQVKRIWMTHTARKDSPVVVLDNAARFFQESEKATAAALLARAQAIDPGGPARPDDGAIPSWSERLGLLYAEAIAGSLNRSPVTSTSQPGDLVFSRDGAQILRGEAAFAVVARQQLEKATDADLLAASGARLILLMMFRRPGFAFDAANAELSRRYLQRALELNPRHERARQDLDRLGQMERDFQKPRAPSPFTNASRESWPAIVAKMPDAERLAVLPCLAEGEYRHAEWLEYRVKIPSSPKDSEPETIRSNRQAATEALARAKAYAQETLELAARSPSDPTACDPVFRVNIVMALVAFREGDQQAAVRYMLDASKVPPPANRSERRFPGEFEGKLTNYLLKHGERASVAEYLERASEGRHPAERARMLKEAAAIRAGMMPDRYQWLLANGSI